MGCKQCNEIETAVEGNKNLSGHVVEVRAGNDYTFEHRISVDQCPNCGKAVYGSLEDFLVDGCQNCDYDPKIEFVLDETENADNSETEGGTK